ncbi:MAG: chemotaxis protein, partial [Marinitoga sp. 4572_148]
MLQNLHFIIKLAFYYKIPELGWTVYTAIPKAVIKNTVWKQTYIFVVIGLIILIGAFVIGIVFVNKAIVKPIIALSKTMEEVGKGKLNVKAEVNSKNELGKLAEIINQTLLSLKTLVEKVQKSSETLIETSENVSKSIDKNAEINRRIYTDIEKINAKVQDASSSLEETTAGVEEIAAAAQSVSKSTQEVMEKTSEMS